MTILSQVAQWSDLVVFDFLTGNYDRVSSMQVSSSLQVSYHLDHRFYSVEDQFFQFQDTADHLVLFDQCC